MKIEYIEPLIEKLKSLARSGEQQCLRKGLALYGSDDDVESLVQLIQAKYRRGSLIIVDFTPFMSLGSQTRLQRLLTVYRDLPYILLVRKGIVLDQLKMLRDVATIVVDDNYTVLECSFPGKRRVSLTKNSKEYFRNGVDAFAVHSRWVEDQLNEVIPRCLRMPPAERRYTRLADDTWANLWIDVKSILKDPNMAFFIAYQLGYVLSKGYSQIPEEEILVVGNNNAYVLASFLSQILDDKELIMLDRLGPYPSLSRTRLLETQRLEGKQSCVIEDVLGTGREMDMITLLTFMAKGQVQRVACLYDLEIASPLLVPQKNVLSLCRPSLNIDYKRLPKYEANIKRSE